MISKISSRVGARRIFVVRPGGGSTPTPTPTPTSTPTNTPTPTPVVYYYYYLRDCNQTHNKIGRSLTSGLGGITYSVGNSVCYEIVGLDPGPTFDYDLDTLTIVSDCNDVVCLTPTPTPTPTSTETSTPLPTETPTPTPTNTPELTPTPTPFIPENDFTYTIIPNNDLSYILIPNNDLVYLLIPNDDLTYTLIPSNDLTHTLIPNNDLLFTLVPDGGLTYVLLPDNDLNPIEVPNNDVNYTLIPNTDLTYTLIPNNDIEYSVLKPPTVFYGQIILGEDSVEGTCNCAEWECPRFYVTGDGPTFCDSNIFVITGGGTFFNGWGTIVHNGYYKTVNMDGTNIATYRTDCGTCPTTPTPTPTSEPTPTPTPTLEPCSSGFTISNCGTSHVYTQNIGVPWTSYGENYLQVGPSQDGGGLVAPQAGWYFVDDCGRVRQLLNTPIWISGGQNSPWPNGSGWLCVVNAPFILGDNVQTLTFCESMPIVSEITPTPTPTQSTSSPYSYTIQARAIDGSNNKYGWVIQQDACQGGEFNVTIYSNSSTFVDGMNFYSDTNASSINDIVTYMEYYYYYPLENKTFRLLNGNIVGEVASCPTPTPTPTSTSTPTPTPTPTESPIDFSVSSTCDMGGSYYTFNHTGGSGQYDRSTSENDTEYEALTTTQWMNVPNPGSYVTSGVGVPNITKTYWVAVRDRNNPSNVVAKSIIVDCTP